MKKLTRITGCNGLRMLPSSSCCSRLRYGAGWQCHSDLSPPSHGQWNFLAAGNQRGPSTSLFPSPWCCFSSSISGWCVWQDSAAEPGPCSPDGRTLERSEHDGPFTTQADQIRIIADRWSSWIGRCNKAGSQIWSGTTRPWRAFWPRGDADVRDATTAHETLDGP